MPLLVSNIFAYTDWNAPIYHSSKSLASLHWFWPLATYTCCSFSISIWEMPDGCCWNGDSVLVPDGKMEHLKQSSNNWVVSSGLKVLLLILVPPIPTICIPLILIEFPSKLNVASWVHCDFASRQHKATFSSPILLHQCPMPPPIPKEYIGRCTVLLLRHRWSNQLYLRPCE